MTKKQKRKKKEKEKGKQRHSQDQRGVWSGGKPDTRDVRHDRQTRRHGEVDRTGEGRVRRRRYVSVSVGSHRFGHSGGSDPGVGSCTRGRRAAVQASTATIAPWRHRLNEQSTRWNPEEGQDGEIGRRWSCEWEHESEGRRRASGMLAKPSGNPEEGGGGHSLRFGTTCDTHTHTYKVTLWLSFPDISAVNVLFICPDRSTLPLFFFNHLKKNFFLMLLLHSFHCRRSESPFHHPAG